MLQRTFIFTLALVASVAVQGFTVIAPSAITQVKVPATSALFAKDDEPSRVIGTVERGVSVDQDGKSNVWAIEPKIEISNKSSEEQSQLALFAGVGIVGAAVAAGFILSNLPDPNQF